MAITLKQIIGSITGKLAFERTQENFTTIKDAHNALETSVESKASDADLLAHKADMTTQLGRVEFSLTALAGYTYNPNDAITYTINNITYFTTRVRRSDGGSFPTGYVDMLTVPHNFLGVYALASYARDSNGNPVNARNGRLASYNKTISIEVVSTNIDSIYITGWYLVN